MRFVRQNEKSTKLSRISGAHAILLALTGLVGGAFAHPPDRSAEPPPHRGAGIPAARAGAGPGTAPPHDAKPAAVRAEPGAPRADRTAGRARTGAYGGPADHHGSPGSPGYAARRLHSAPARALAEASHQLAHLEALRAEAARSWGLSRVPLRPPPPPAEGRGPAVATGDLASGPGLPPVLTRIPTTDRVIFLTIDDGARKDPELIRMTNRLQIPFSAFLTDEEVRDDYSYFRELRRLGVAMHNHTLHHPNLPRLTYGQQRREICEQQQNLLRETGEWPRLFRPPFGNYNRDTLVAAGECGIRAVPLWSAEAFPDRIDFSDGGNRLRPGDIILTHFRGPAVWDGDMPDVIRRVLETATAQGFAVARLEDYL